MEMSPGVCIFFSFSSLYLLLVTALQEGLRIHKNKKPPMMLPAGLGPLTGTATYNNSDP
jgi:hypothetical protein